VYFVLKQSILFLNGRIIIQKIYQGLD